jgi:hypothetical protein
MSTELMPKRFELLSELVPQARVMALLVNPNYANTERIIRDVQEAARGKGVQLHILKAGNDRRRLRLPPRTACRRPLGRRRPVLQQPARAARDSGITPFRPREL